jgi:hypothetical protein
MSEPNLPSTGGRSDARVLNEDRRPEVLTDSGHSRLSKLMLKDRMLAKLLTGNLIMARRGGRHPADRSDIVGEAGFRAPSGHPDRRLVSISLILLCRAWSELDAHVVVCNCVGDPFKAWVSRFLRRILQDMVNHKSLSVSESVPDTAPADLVWGLQSDEILRKGVTGRVSLSHNILFDYASARVLLDEENVVAFIRDDPTRTIFFRPTLS